jgi:large subunit ribosomal protein L4
MNVPVYNMQGKEVAQFTIDEQSLGGEINASLIKQAYVRYHANLRQGSARTKNRTQVEGSTRKIYKQKGTGNARHGSRRVNVFRGGGQVHGPRPRSYEFSMNKKARAGALRSALSLRTSEGNLIVIRDFAVPDAKTRNLVNALTKLDAQHALLVDDGGNVSLRRSSSNLQKALHLAPEGVNVYDILRHPKLLISEAALRRVEARLLGQTEESEGATP